MSSKWNFKGKRGDQRSAISSQPEKEPSQARASDDGKKAGRRVSGNDVLAGVGLCVLAVGLWMYSPALAFVVVGVALLIIGLAGAVYEAVNDGK